MTSFILELKQRICKAELNTLFLIILYLKQYYSTFFSCRQLWPIFKWWRNCITPSTVYAYYLYSKHTSIHLKLQIGTSMLYWLRRNPLIYSNLRLSLRVICIHDRKNKNLLNTKCSSLSINEQCYFLLSYLGGYHKNLT